MRTTFATAAIALTLAASAQAGELPVFEYFVDGMPYYRGDSIYNLSASGGFSPNGALASVAPDIVAGLNAAIAAGDRAALESLLAELDAELAARGITLN
jgi:hypothetical protein